MCVCVSVRIEGLSWFGAVPLALAVRPQLACFWVNWVNNRGSSEDKGIINSASSGVALPHLSRTRARHLRTNYTDPKSPSGAPLSAAPQAMLEALALFDSDPRL